MRPFATADASAVQRLAGAREIAEGTLTIPHPYPDGAAEEWIRSQSGDVAAGKGAVFAVVKRDEDALVGSTGLVINRDHGHAELGYWIGVPYWGRGYATEAAEAVVRHGFRALDLHRIFARCFTGNPASARVLEKIGMRHEGRQREHILKDGVFLDIEQYGLLRRDWTG